MDIPMLARRLHGSRFSFSEPSKMDTNTQAQGFLVGIRQILIHGAITLLAIVIAFSLPPAARYILYVWWPRVETNTSLLLVTEIGLASALVLLFNLGKVAWDNRNTVAMARLTALVYARDARNDWLSRLRERALAKSLPAARDACVLTLTGHGTFVDERSPVREVLRSAYEIRVMLVNPVGEGVRRWACRIVRSGPRRVMDSQQSTVTIRLGFVAMREGRQCMRSSRRGFLKFLVTSGLAGPGWAFAGAAPAARGEVLELTATEALSAIAAGDLRAETYAAILLGRARSLRNLNVLIAQDPEQVLEAARAADKARAHGHLLGPLHGLP